MQVPRAAAALLLAPAADRLMAMLQSRLRLESKRQAAGLIVGTCFSLALALFGVTVVAWA